METTEALVVRSINDLTERHGFGPMASATAPLFQSFCLQDDPDGLWIAEEGDRILGFAFSWACGDLWFLAQLFIAPDQQSRGIGNALLQRTLEHARKAGATHKALITFTFNKVSQGLYIRHGLFPRMPIYLLDIPRDLLQSRLQPVPLRCVELQNTASHLRNLAEVDARALGVSREKHHKFLIGDGATRGALLYAKDDCVGYAYVSRQGHIGPLAVARSDALEPAFRTALTLAADNGSSRVSAFLPGTAEPALASAIAHKMRITFPMLLMSTRGFGDWTRYLPRNPGFM